MKPLLRPVLVTLGSFLVVGALFYCFSMLSFCGLFDKRVTREETVANFAKHERDILNFSDWLRSKNPSFHEIFLSLPGSGVQQGMDYNCSPICYRFVVWITEKS